MLSYHLGILAFSLFTGRAVKMKLLLKGWSLKLFIGFFLACAVNGYLIYLMWGMVEKPGSVLGNQLSNLGIHEGNLIIFMVYYSFFTPWLEEHFWRDLMATNSIKPDLSDLLFAGYHLLVVSIFIKPIYLPVIFVSLLGIAWFWRWCKRKLGGLLIPSLTHLIADVSTILAVYFITQN